MIVKKIDNLVQTVALKDVKCFGFHGFYPEEQIIGCYFILDLEVSFTPKNFNDEIQFTVNYENLNTILLEEMQATKKLLETVLNSILDRIVADYPFINSAMISINKLNPPMPGEVGSSFVKLEYVSNKD